MNAVLQSNCSAMVLKKGFFKTKPNHSEKELLKSREETTNLQAINAELKIKVLALEEQKVIREEYIQQLLATMVVADKNVDAPTQPPEPANPHSFVGMKVCKYFLVQPGSKKKKTRRLFYGIVESYDEDQKWWKIVYDDDDGEEVDKSELDDLLKLYEHHNTV